MISLWAEVTFQTNSTIQQVILYTYLPMKMEQGVPKRRHIKFRRRGITQKKAYKTQQCLLWNKFSFLQKFARCLI